eukprot:scaffold228352_cov19-Tisochrysis_lutea.AAC.1
MTRRPSVKAHNGYLVFEEKQQNCVGIQCAAAVACLRRPIQSQWQQGMGRKNNAMIIQYADAVA